MRILIIALLLSVSVFSQNYELGAGTVIAKDKQMNAGYYIEANFHIKTDQNRNYLNKLLFGFSHAGYMSNNIAILAKKEVTTEKTDCNCESSTVNFAEKEYKQKKMVRIVSLLFGVETLKRFYLTTGISSSKHIEKIDDKEVSSYYTTHIDAGVKYYIKYKNSFIVPSVKFNPEIISIGISYSR